jgi:hypothetical protein
MTQVDASEISLEIEDCFAADNFPTESELLLHDGFDELEKVYAQKSFPGLDWLTLFNELKSRTRPGVSNLLEEWTILQPKGICYYARPLLLYLVTSLRDSTADDEFVGFLFWSLHSILKQKGSKIFNPSQIALLVKLGGFARESIRHHEFDICRGDINSALDECIHELKT